MSLLPLQQRQQQRSTIGLRRLKLLQCRQMLVRVASET